MTRIATSNSGVALLDDSGLFTRAAAALGIAVAELERLAREPDIQVGVPTEATLITARQQLTRVLRMIPAPDPACPHARRKLTNP